MSIKPQGTVAYLTLSVPDMGGAGHTHLSVWFNPGSIARDGTLFSYFENGGSEFFRIFTFSASGGGFGIEAGDAFGLSSVQGGTLSTNTWHHVLAEIRSDTDRRLRINGVEVATDTGNVVLTTALDTLQIAAVSDGSRLRAGLYADAAVIFDEFTEDQYELLADGFSPWFLSITRFGMYSRFVVTPTPGDSSMFDEISGNSWVKTGNANDPQGQHPTIHYPSTVR